MTPATQLRAVRASSLLLPVGQSRRAFSTAGGSKPGSIVRHVAAAAASSSWRAGPFASASPAHHLVRRASTFPPSSSSSSASSLEPTAPVLAHAAANPPDTTRPPPLTLPERTPQTSTFSHLLATGKAYLAFYKTGLRYLYTNTKLVRAADAAQGTSTHTTTRADLLLRRRWAHDMRRLPLFGLLLLVCGEFTPFVVLVFPHVVPYPCRIPKQVAELRRQAEGRRRRAFEAVGAADANPSTEDALVARSLGLVAPLWDRLGLLAASPGLARRAVDRRLRFLALDDALLRQAGGAPALEADEVLLACEDRGLDVLGRDENRLRERLAAWLALTRPIDSGPGSAESDAAVEERMVELLTRRPEAWPRK